ncbi:phosphoglycolate phosphatase [Curvibacter sp. HBC61]|uniref:phosphoglycolate phosphatase n=1 Tax=Curvibacter cyanobacteriorum TaxID=3026422 RepID=A0ABT5MZ62_9BURK|nr:phosphoglycolate phosphatase [Curvibacter sp. HBC61]MDD0839117.1 phosphoglycolate phosphatase [Curvibacter sp. HBC61]
MDLVMFDLDGTLVATAGEISDAVNDTLARFHLPAVPQAQVERWIGHGTRELLLQALASAGQTRVEVVRASSTLALIAAEFDRHYQRRSGTLSQLYPQVRETLTALRERGVKLAVVTNKESRYTATVLDAHGLTPLFDCVVSGDTLPTKKPDPAGIRSCLARFQVPPERALFVGDSSIDVATARNAGVRVWALPCGYNLGEPITACAPDRVINDLSALR